MAFRQYWLLLPLLAASPVHAACVTDYKELFHKLDTSKDGFLDASELKAVPAEYRKAVIVGIDANGDQKVDIEEYVKYREEDPVSQNLKTLCKDKE